MKVTVSLIYMIKQKDSSKENFKEDKSFKSSNPKMDSKMNPDKDSKMSPSGETFKQVLKGGDNTVNEFSHIEPVQQSFLEVKVNGNFERASRFFRSLVQKSGILTVYKERSRFEKPSVTRRRKKNEGKRKAYLESQGFNLDKFENKSM